MIQICIFAVLLVVFGDAVNGQIKYDCSGPPPAFKRPEDCCKYPSLIDNSIIGQCKSKYGLDSGTTGRPTGAGGPGGPGGPGGRGKFACVVECAFNQTGLNVNGNLNQAKLTQYFSAKMNGDASLTKALNNAITTCFKESQDEKKGNKLDGGRPSQQDDDSDNCGHESVHTLMCVSKNLVMNCPKPSGDADCKKMIDFFKQCPNSNGPRGQRPGGPQNGPNGNKN